MQSALPISIRMRDDWRAQCRPKTSAIVPQKGMKQAEVRLKTETIQFCWDSLPVGVECVGLGVREIEGSERSTWCVRTKVCGDPGQGACNAVWDMVLVLHLRAWRKERFTS